MRVSMYFLHLELTFTPHYIITDKGYWSLPVSGVQRCSGSLEQPREARVVLKVVLSTVEVAFCCAVLSIQPRHS